MEFSIEINAPVEKVRDTMLSEEGYKIRSSVFNPGSRYEGDWSLWSEIRFIGPDPSHPEDIGGLYWVIRENRLYEYVSIEYYGEVQNGKKVPKAERHNAQENYKFKHLEEGKTFLMVELDTAQDFSDFFKETRPQALKKLKSMCEE